MSDLTPKTAAALHHDLVDTWRSTGAEAVAEKLGNLECDDLFYMVMMFTGFAAE